MKKDQSPLISIVCVTFNRAHLIERSIESVIAQHYQNWELILVDNGSTDHTADILEKYKKPEYQDKIRIFHLAENRKFAGGTNVGLEKIRGEWFTLHDDDDEILPEALATLISIPLEKDPSITAVSCNCLDTTTKQSSGFGFDTDRYLSFEDIMVNARGEFWGITKTELLGDKRLNENILGYEAIMWNQIDKIAKRYYVHKNLRVWYTDHGPTITKKSWSKDLGLKVHTYRHLINEFSYWENIQEFTPKKYRNKLIKGLFYSSCDADLKTFQKYIDRLFPDKKSIKRKLTRLLFNSIHPAVLKGLYKMIPA